MSYLAFSLKYRPKNFDEVVGQEHVISSLKNAISKKHVHHAYLFSGPRGVGKTSVARILAKSLNCSSGPTLTPCDKCVSCLGIAQGKSLDTIEIDGASNRGIDEIRVLRENVKLSAVHSRYKIYIIDEVHMLTKEAFNALLKTLEEPPAHVKFIFATTHPNKVIPTILSRCQKFQFTLIRLKNIVAKLKKVIDAEKVSVDEKLLYTIARVSGGSIRDAESLLDQLVPVITEKNLLENVFSFLGIMDEDSLNRMLKNLVEKDLVSCLDFLDKISKDGKDLGVFLDAFIEHARTLLLAKVGVENFKEIGEISPQCKDFIGELSKKISVREAVEMIDLLIEAKDFSRRLATVRVPLEVAIIKFAYSGEPECGRQPVKSAEVTHGYSKNVKETVVARKEENKSGTDIEKNYMDELDLEIEKIDIPEEPAAPVLDGENKEKKESGEAAAEKDNFLLQEAKANWDKIIIHMQRIRAAIASHLSFSRPVYSAGRVLTIAFSTKESFHKDILEHSKNQQFVEKTFSELLGKQVGIKFVLQDLPQGVQPAGTGGEDGAKKKINFNEARSKDAQDKSELSEKSIDDDTFINDLLDTFGGKFHSEG